MPFTNRKQDCETDGIVNLMLIGGRVTRSFREQLFVAAANQNLSVNEFCIRAVGEKLRNGGARFSGVFTPGDMPAHNDN